MIIAFFLLFWIDMFVIGIEHRAKRKKLGRYEDQKVIFSGLPTFLPSDFLIF